MAQSVKLTNGSYIDTEGVYDATKGETQSAINNRLGMVVSTTLSTDNSWTSTKSGETHHIASLTLPKGIWLAIGNYQDVTGYVRVMIQQSAPVLMRSVDGHDGAISSNTCLRAMSVVNGNQTVYLDLNAMEANKTYKWGQDRYYWSFNAICIG